MYFFGVGGLKVIGYFGGFWVEFLVIGFQYIHVGTKIFPFLGAALLVICELCAPY